MVRLASYSIVVIRAPWLVARPPPFRCADRGRDRKALRPYYDFVPNTRTDSFHEGFWVSRHPTRAGCERQ
jgi:hypothetical protein